MAGTVDISIVIPTYNEGPWLARTVDSIYAARTELRFEVVIVDDGCTDGSLEVISHGDRRRIVSAGGDEPDVVIARNRGADAAAGQYLCFVDSHTLVTDYWLDHLRQTCDLYGNRALVSGRIADVDQISSAAAQPCYSYTICNCKLQSAWHPHPIVDPNRPYLEPLTPGGLMFATKAHFLSLGGFDSILRGWGAEDTQISLQNYCMGGDNVVDPRVVVYHYFKNASTRQRSFPVSSLHYGLNRLYIAAMYLPSALFLQVRRALALEDGENFLAAQRPRIERMQAEFARTTETWIAEFAPELKRFLRDAGLLDTG